MQEDIENKSLTLIINTSKLTARTLATAFMKFLRYSKGKVQAHHDVKPQGRQSVKQLVTQNQGVEKTELADREEVKIHATADMYNVTPEQLAEIMKSIFGEKPLPELPKNLTVASGEPDIPHGEEDES